MHGRVFVMIGALGFVSSISANKENLLLFSNRCTNVHVVHACRKGRNVMNFLSKQPSLMSGKMVSKFKSNTKSKWRLQNVL